ncbi:MAG: FAD-binding oxidoreductase [Bacteroidia bacterium]
MLSKTDIEFFEELIGHTNVRQNLEDLNLAASDYTEDLFYLPEVVLLPDNSAEISSILKYCNSKLIPVYTRGAGTGLSGACLPVKGGVVLSTKRLNKIIDIDIENLQATVEPGVINQDLKNELSSSGLTYPPDPASMGSSTIGGNIAHGSGGPKAVKYGVTRDYVLNLEVVLPTGDVIWTGANTLKNSTAFSLTHLMIGSEGLLGVITKAVLKLVPLKSEELLMLAAFDNAESAAICVNKILLNGFLPAGIELMEKSGVEIVLNQQQYNFPTPETAEFFLMIILDGNDQNILMQTAEELYPLLEENNAVEVFLPNNADMAEEWWSVRRKMGEAVKSQSIYKEEDTVVPRSKLPQLLTEVKKIESKYGFRTVCYGHSGDGNLHINILKDNLTDDEWNIEVPKGIREIFQLCKDLGGTISGEHGIGLVQKDYLDIVMTPTHMKLFSGIKTAFDPHNILNPGKWVESSVD